MAPKDDLCLVRAALELGAKDGRHGAIEDRIEKIWGVLNQPHQHIEPYESILRNLLLKMQGDKAEAEALRRYPTVWSILGRIFGGLQLVILARYLTEGNFYPTFIQTIKDLASSPASTSIDDAVIIEPDKRSGKRKHRSDTPFDLDLLQTPALSLASAAAFLDATHTLFDRIRDPSIYRDTREQKSVNVIRAIFAAQVADLCADQIGSLLQICQRAHVRPSGDAFGGEEVWISTIVSLWDLRQSAAYVQTDGQVAASTISSPAFSLYHDLVFGNRSRPQSIVDSWIRDLKQFLIETMLLPSRDEYANAESTEIVQAILVKRMVDSSFLPLIIDLLFETASLRMDKDKICRDDYLWIRAFFSSAEDSVRFLDESTRATVIVDMLKPRANGQSLDEALGPAVLQKLYNKYILEQKETHWGLVERVLRLPDVFLGGEPGRKVLTDVLDRIQKASSSQLSDSHDLIRLVLSRVGNGFAEAGNLHEFLTKWVGYLSKAEKKRAEGGSKSRSIWFSVLELVQARFKTRRQLEVFLAWLEVEDVQPGAVLVVLAAIAKNIRSRVSMADLEFAQSVETRLYNIMAARIPLSQELPVDLATCRWEIIGGTVTWETREESDLQLSLNGDFELEAEQSGKTASVNIWTATSGAMLDILHTGDLSSIVTFGALRACAAWADVKRYGDIGEKALDEFYLLLSRVGGELPNCKAIKWQADPSDPSSLTRNPTGELVYQKHWTKSEHQHVFPVYYLDALFLDSKHDGLECCKALHEFARRRPSQFRDFMNSVFTSLSLRNPDALRLLLRSLASRKMHLESREMRGWLISILIHTLDAHNWDEEDWRSSMSLAILTTVPDHLFTREHRDRIMQSWNTFRTATWNAESSLPTQQESAKPLSVTNWSNCVALLGKAMKQSILSEETQFKHLVDISDCISKANPHDESETSSKLAVGEDVKRLACCVISQMSSASLVNPKSTYFSDAADLISEFSSDKKGEYPHRIIILGELVRTLQVPDKSNNTAFAPVCNKAAKVLGKIISNGLKLVSKMPKYAPSAVKRWMAGETGFSEQEREQLGLYLLPLSLSLDYLPILQATRASSVTLDIADLDKSADKMVAAELDVGFTLKCYLLRNQRDELRELSTLSHDTILGLNTDISTAAPLVEAFIDGLSNTERMEFLYQLIFSHIDATRYQPIAISALGYLITHVENEGIVPPGWKKPFNLNEAHIQLCELLTLARPLPTLLGLSAVVQKSLARDSGALLQEAIEETLSTLCRISCPEAYRAGAFSSLCKVVEICLKTYRVRMAQRLHLLMEAMCRLLALLVDGEFLALQSLKPMSNEDKTRRATQFVGLVRRVCEPTTGAVGGGSRGRGKGKGKGKGGGVDAATVEAYRDDAGAIVFLVVIKYVDLVLREGRPVVLASETETILRPGLCGVFNVVKEPIRDFLGGSLGPNEWTLVKEMYAEFKRGKVGVGK